MTDLKADLDTMADVRTRMIDPALTQMQQLTAPFDGLRAHPTAQELVGNLVCGQAMAFDVLHGTVVGVLTGNQDALVAGLRAFEAALAATEKIYRTNEQQTTEHVVRAGG